MQKIFSRLLPLFTLLLGFSISAALTVAQAAEEVPAVGAESSNDSLYYNGNEDDWAAPLGMVTPIYPPIALSQKCTGYVDMELSISSIGKVVEIRVLTPEPKNEDFEAAAKESVMQWLFHVPARKGCTPEAFLAIQRIWFDINDGKPEIGYSKVKQKQVGSQWHNTPVRAFFLY